MADATLELNKSANVDTAYAVVDGQKHKVQLIATPEGTLELPASPASDTGYLITADGKKHKVKLVASLAGGSGGLDQETADEIENNASVLKTTQTLNQSVDMQKTLTASYLNAFSNLDTRPSHKAKGAWVFSSNGEIGIVDDVVGSRLTITTVHTAPAGIPSGGGSYKFLGSEGSTTAKWIYGLVLDDIYANETMASANYFGEKPFMSKTGAYETTKFQTYTVKSVSSPASFTLNSDTSNGQIVITDAAMLFAEIKRMWIDSYGGYGAITQIEPGQTITLTFNVDDYYGPTMLQYNMEVYISNPSTGDSFTGNSIYVTSSDFSMMGLSSTLTTGGMYTMELTVGSVGGSGYQYESQGCAKIQAATADNPTYAFAMPGNMVQMGGIVNLPNIGPGVAVDNNPVTLPRELANANYVVQLTVITESGFQQIAVDASNRTTTGFEVCARNNDTAATITGAKVAWTVVGILPMTTFSGLA